MKKRVNRKVSKKVKKIIKGISSSLEKMSFLMTRPMIVFLMWFTGLESEILLNMSYVVEFMLERPFKMILRVMDNWFDFLSRKKDEVVG